MGICHLFSGSGFAQTSDFSVLDCPIIYIPFQTLCILTNVADGDDAKGYIIENEDVLKKLMTYMVWYIMILILYVKDG